MISPSAYLEPLGPIDHPLENLCEMSAEEILAAYRVSQLSDVEATFRRLRRDGRDLSREIELLQHYLLAYPAENVQRRLRVDAVEQLFYRMHTHVMAHPVWVHPFFARVAEGNITAEQLAVFARQYFNQVKNTRQCVALALGRFHTMLNRPDGELNTILSELTQMVLAGLLSDEYGTGEAHACKALQSVGAPVVDIGRLFAPVTHPALYRRFLAALGANVGEYDVPMLHGVADNVLVQRIVAGDPAYDELEALASVGLGMEWGVPAFFSMIMAGIYKVAAQEGLALDARAMEIWSSHVRQDVEHAIAVLIATSFYVSDDVDVKRIEGVTNVLMAYRYDMMSDIYREVFGEPCDEISKVALDACYALHDPRIVPLLSVARQRVRPQSVRGYAGYVASR